MEKIITVPGNLTTNFDTYNYLSELQNIVIDCPENEKMCIRDSYDTRQMTVEELKALIWRYFLSYWNNRRICSANGGLPPMIKRRQYYEDLELVA